MTILGALIMIVGIIASFGGPPPGPARPPYLFKILLMEIVGAAMVLIGSM